MTGLIQGDRSDDRHLVFRSSTCLATRLLSAEVGLIDLDLSLQHVGLLPPTHCPQDLVVHQPVGVASQALLKLDAMARHGPTGMCANLRGRIGLGGASWVIKSVFE